ncbi:uncharacterized protein [Epargyreus clarus]|uniref:uncharacterized protein isoform X3 n=1 Tax=Epargyreus clarus TaxID=520877 RepID=UPI003C2FA721
MPSPGSRDASCYSGHTRARPESPRRSRCVSPRKASPIGRLSYVPSAVSQLIGSLDYEAYGSDILDSIPEHDWKLLAALARKREEDEERERLAEQFQKMWMKEKEERQLVEAETTGQYKKYLQEKRDQERSFLEYKRLERDLDEGIKRGQLISCIRHKEKRSADLLAFRDDKKATDLVSKALEEDARALLAADRRWRHSASEEWRKHVELVHANRRAEDAKKRKDAFLKDAAQRVAISNALSSWESTLLRQEVEAQEAAKRACTAAASALKDARRSRLQRARDVRRTRAATLADLTARMRDAVRTGRGRMYSPRKTASPL